MFFASGEQNMAKVVPINDMVRKTDNNFSTNTIMRYYQGKNRPTYYLPTYIRTKILSIAKIKYEEMNAQVNAEIYITIIYPPNYPTNEGSINIKQYLLEQGIKCSFQKGPCLKLRRDNKNISIQDENVGMITYIIRTFVSTTLECDDIFWAPFETVKCRLSLSLYRIRIFSDLSEEIREIHFNMMDIEGAHNMAKKIVASPYANFGLFGICINELSTTFTKSLLLVTNNFETSKQPKIKKKESINFQKNMNPNGTNQHLPLLKRNYGKERPDAFNAAHFSIKLYKKPAVSLVTIFIPLLLMAILNLGIFYQRPNLHKRILSISALMVSIVALVPTIRDEIPPIPKITFVEILVFLESLTTILALVDSLSLGDIGDDDPYVFDAWSNPLFMIAFLITILVNLNVLIIYCLYKFRWEKKYKFGSEISEQINYQEETVDYYQWSNRYCDEEFVKFYDESTLEVINHGDIEGDMLFRFAESIYRKRKDEGAEAFEMPRFGVASYGLDGLDRVSRP